MYDDTSRVAFQMNTETVQTVSVIIIIIVIIIIKYPGRLVNLMLSRIVPYRLFKTKISGWKPKSAFSSLY